MRIVFMGTSEFAIPSLKQLHFSSNNIVAVVTQPDRPKGRGLKLSQSPIKKVAVELGYKVMQPNQVNSSNFLNKIKNLNIDLFIVVAFGKILSEYLLKIPKKGAINVHPSLVPKYRGPAPIQWAIINGDKETGVTTMLMDSGMDTGCILLTETTNIQPYETSICLHDRLSKIGSKLLLKTIDKIKDNSLLSIKQNCNCATIAPMLKKKDGEINWYSHAKKIEAFIRGMNPWPGAFTFYAGKRLKILKANIVNINFTDSPGTVLNSYPGNLYIATKKNAISIEMVQLGSGKQLSIDAFLCGHKIPCGSIFGCLK